jgi:acetoacetate decarboxylase
MPPRFGNLDTSKFKPGNISDYKTDALTLKGVQILELHMEIDDDPADALIPKTMHPAIPMYAIFNVMHAPQSEWGPFTIAEVRAAGRTGVRPRGFVLRSYVDNEEAAKALTSRWGFPVARGDASLRVLHDRITGRVKLGGKTVYEIEEQDRDSISGNDIQYIASMHLAHSKVDNKLVVVQVDPEYVFHKAERGRPRVVALDPEAFGATAKTLNVMGAISACFTTADITIPKIRYICNPDLPAMQGTTKVAA